MLKMVRYILEVWESPFLVLNMLLGIVLGAKISPYPQYESETGLHFTFLVFAFSVMGGCGNDYLHFSNRKPLKH